MAEHDELSLPEMLFVIAGAVVVFDHRLRTVRVLNNAFLDAGDDLDKAYDRAQQRICEILDRLKAPTKLPPLALDCPRLPLSLPKQSRPR